MFSVDDRTVFLTIAGSHAHGTASEGSDVDLRGVCVLPLPERLSLFYSFEQYEGALSEKLASVITPRLQAHRTAALAFNAKAECIIYDIAKFLRLCAAGNPHTIEILFADERDWAFETSVWRGLHKERHRFLTQKVQQTFLDYAMAQLRRIKTHRSWLLNPPAKKPSRSDFGLPETGGTLSQDDRNRIERSIADKVRGYGIDDIEMGKSTRLAVQERMNAFFRDLLAVTHDEVEEGVREVAGHALSAPASVLATLSAERKYQAAMRNWKSFLSWKNGRNPARAVLETRHGYDTKHAMHLIRLMRMGLEVLKTGELNVCRPDASELKAIRNGARSFDQLLADANRLQEEMKSAAAIASLPRDVDRSWVDDLLYQIVTSQE